MKKLFSLLSCVLLVTACSYPDLVIYNGCKGSWVQVLDGDGHLVVDHLPYGQPATVSLRQYDGRQATFLAWGYSLEDNRPMGSATWSLYVPRSTNSPTGPSEVPPWEIVWLYDSDNNNGCEQ